MGFGIICLMLIVCIVLVTVNAIKDEGFTWESRLHHALYTDLERDLRTYVNIDARRNKRFINRKYINRR